jgi:hypothetical protein
MLFYQVFGLGHVASGRRKEMQSIGGAIRSTEVVAAGGKGNRLVGLFAVRRLWPQEGMAIDWWGYSQYGGCGSIAFPLR